ncbi:uncharacterized protein B0H18DRAFT_3366 [Fomitopsis serialis]|uniref:uncharacterized protein n=1 Tax=Fomitopsis serialis TaxID=139415 RepID=UPI00200899AA|nr:uncharacterized protein B0H18DRAFT_3366 [Neoantrodia serialis]KAH9938106.1 hypothetical protein B0H18DRAFT_3366 [Neoantrodia serialis]
MACPTIARYSSSETRERWSVGSMYTLRAQASSVSVGQCNLRILTPVAMLLELSKVCHHSRKAREPIDIDKIYLHPPLGNAEDDLHQGHCETGAARSCYPPGAGEAQATDGTPTADADAVAPDTYVTASRNARALLRPRATGCSEGRGPAYLREARTHAPYLGHTGLPRLPRPFYVECVGRGGEGSLWREGRSEGHRASTRPLYARAGQPQYPARSWRERRHPRAVVNWRTRPTSGPHAIALG